MPYTFTKRQIFYLSRNERMKPLPLSKAIEGFMLACRARRLSINTILDYERTCKKFIDHTGDIPIRDITPTQVAAFLAAQKDFSAKTVLNYHIGLSALWTWAIREDYAERHILRVVEKPRPQKVVVEPFTALEIRALLASVRRNADRDRACIFLLLDTGMRASELCGLKTEDIDMANRRVKVLGKGNKERLLPFSSRTGSALFRHISSAPPGLPFPLTRTSLAHLMQLIGKRAGLNDVHPHRFRHTFAIQFLRNGGDAFALQELLGHTTMETVRIYLRIAQVDIDSAHKRASPVDNWKL